jgi:hypothetical protein
MPRKRAHRNSGSGILRIIKALNGFPKEHPDALLKNLLDSDELINEVENKASAPQFFRNRPALKKN